MTSRYSSLVDVVDRDLSRNQGELRSIDQTHDRQAHTTWVQEGRHANRQGGITYGNKEERHPRSQTPRIWPAKMHPMIRTRTSTLQAATQQHDGGNGMAVGSGGGKHKMHGHWRGMWAYRAGAEDRESVMWRARS